MFSRRGFIQSIMLGAASVALSPQLLGSIANAVANGEALGPNGAEDTFVEGMVISRTGADIQFRGPAGEVTALNIAGANIWRGKDGIQMDAINKGDYLYARAVFINGQLVATNLWVNIVNVSGVLSEGDSKMFILEHGRLRYSVMVGPDAEYFRGLEKLASPPKLVSGDIVQVIGLWEGNNRITATRVFSA